MPDTFLRNYNAYIAVYESFKEFDSPRWSARPATDALVAVLGHLKDGGQQLQVLNGIRDSLQGRLSVPMPTGWKEQETKLRPSGDASVRAQARALAITFGSTDAIEASRKILSDDNSAAPDRLAAMDSLVGIKDAGLALALQNLLDDGQMRAAALRGLAGYDDAKTSSAIVLRYPAFDSAE